MTRFRLLPAFAVALLVALTPGRPSVRANCTPEKDAPTVIFQSAVTGTFDPDLAFTLSQVCFFKLIESSPGVHWTDIRQIAAVLSNTARQMRLGTDNTSLEGIAGRVGSPFRCNLVFDDRLTGRVATLTLISSRSEANVRRFEKRFTSDSAGFSAMEEIGAQTGADLLCALQADRPHPVVPHLALVVTPGEVSPKRDGARESHAHGSERPNGAAGEVDPDRAEDRWVPVDLARLRHRLLRRRQPGLERRP